jgi:hypothetical protein
MLRLVFSARCTDMDFKICPHWQTKILPFPECDFCKRLLIKQLRDNFSEKQGVLMPSKCRFIATLFHTIAI